MLTAGTFLYVYASKRVPAATASVISTSEIVWGYLVQIVAFGETPSVLTAVGVTVMLSSTIGIVTGGKDHRATISTTISPIEPPDAKEYSNVAITEPADPAALVLAAA
jgi:hypothetical protein